MAGNSNKDADIDSSFTSVPATQELFSSPEPADIFLTVQRSTFAVGKIYNDLFANSRSDFISELSELCCVAELRYVRGMVLCIVKRKLDQSNLGSLIERKSGANVKDNLLKDIYNLYSLGEKSIDALPKNMIRSDTRFCIVRKFRLIPALVTPYLPQSQTLKNLKMTFYPSYLTSGKNLPL